MRPGKYYFISENLSFSEFSRRMQKNDKYRLLWYGSPYFHPTVILSRQSQLSGNLLPPRSCSHRTSQLHWLPQKMKAYFLAFKVWNWDGKISVNHGSYRGTKIYLKGGGSHRNYYTLQVISSHPCGKKSQRSKKLWKNKLKLPVTDLDWIWLLELTQTPSEMAEEPLEMRRQARNP